jgi:hypothetical protein
VEIGEQLGGPEHVAGLDGGQDAAEVVLEQGHALVTPVGVEEQERPRVDEDAGVGLDGNVHEVELGLREAQSKVLGNAGHEAAPGGGGASLPGE